MEKKFVGVQPLTLMQARVNPCLRQMLTLWHSAASLSLSWASGHTALNLCCLNVALIQLSSQNFF